MGLFSGIVEAFTGRPQVKKCCQCGSDNISVTVWTKDGTHVGVVQCDDCKRYRTIKSNTSKDDALKTVVFKWNEEAIFWESQLKKGFGHR